MRTHQSKLLLATLAASAGMVDIYRSNGFAEPILVDAVPAQIKRNHKGEPFTKYDQEAIDKAATKRNRKGKQ